MSTPAVFTINGIAAHLGVSRPTIYGLLRSGRLKARKLGAKTVVTAEDAQAFIDSLPTYEPAQAA